jgi:rod shape-determining protein MreD
MNRFILPFVALVFLVFESIVANMLAGEIFGADWLVVPRFIMILVAYITIYGTRKHGMIYGFLLGLAYDVAYTGILGLYMFMLPLFAYLIAKTMKILQSNLIVSVTVSLLFIVIMELISYQINILIGFADMNFKDFAMIRLIPTLIFNLGCLLIFSYPLKRLIEKMEIAEEGE